MGVVTNGDLLSARVLSFFAGGSTKTQATRIAALDANVVFSPAEVPGVRVWISMPTSTTARVVFAVQDGKDGAPRFLVNDVTLDGGLDEVGQEQLAQVVYLSAHALWAGNVGTSQAEVEQRLELARKPAAPPPPLPKPKAPPPPPATPWFHLGAEYALRSHGDEGVSHGPAIVVGGGLPREEFGLGAWLHLGFWFPRAAEQGSLELDLAGGSVRGGLAPSWRVSQSVWITTEAGPGLDVVHYTPKFSDAAVTPQESSWDFRPFVYGGVDVKWALGSINVSLATLLVFQLQHTHYDITTGGVSSEVLVPAVVQPGIAVGLLW